jgi:hypothetical protein
MTLQHMFGNNCGQNEIQLLHPYESQPLAVVKPLQKVRLNFLLQS